MRNPFVRHRRFLRHVPTRRRLRGGWLHRQLGDRLFADHLWCMNRHRWAGGAAIGTFVSLMPLIGLQMVLAAILALLFRVNLPIALALCFLTNPFTSPVVFPAQYKLGTLLVGNPECVWLPGNSILFDKFMSYAVPMWVGSLLSGVVFGAIAYGLVHLFWNMLLAFRTRKTKKATV